MTHRVHALLCSIILSALAVLVMAKEAEFNTKQFSVSFNKTNIKDVLSLIAIQTGMNIKLSKGISFDVTISESQTTGQAILNKITTEHQLEYDISDSVILVHKKNLAPESAKGVYFINLQYATAKDIIDKLKELIAPTDKILADDKANTLIFSGSLDSFQRIKTIIAGLDTAPKQIMIEAQIVETSDQFARSIGVAIGDLSDRQLNNSSKLTGYSANDVPGSPNIFAKYVISHLDGRSIDLRLAVAQQKGEAKIISKPKVMTLNNQKARIESGTSFSVKSLGSVSGVGTVTGSVITIEAGLVLEILPTIVGNELIKLAININNRQPDEGVVVDGIPGIINNAANTSVIVKNGQTAVIAGLVKQTKSTTRNGVPLLMDIPILGYLFQSHAKNERNNELMIFITPSLMPDLGQSTSGL